MLYDTFISYNSNHSEEARYIYEVLKGSSIKVFFDQESLKGGELWLKGLERGILQSKSIIIIVGPEGVGPWQEYESYLFQMMASGGPAAKVIIPVLLSKASIPKGESIPGFIHSYHAIQFKGSIREDKESLLKLRESIPQLEFSIDTGIERPILKIEEDELLKKTIRWYDENAEFFLEKWKHNLPTSPLEMFLSKLRKKQVKNKVEVLDVGCGPGHHANYLSNNGVKVTGLDLSKTNIELARKQNIEDCEFIHGDMRNLQQIIKKRNCYDGVWACGSVLHLSKERFSRQIYEFIAVLKPGSILGLSLQVGINSRVEDEGRFFERYDEEELLKSLERLGLNIVGKVEDISNQNTVGKPMIKKWVNLVMTTPEEKEILESISMKNTTFSK